MNAPTGAATEEGELASAVKATSGAIALIMKLLDFNPLSQRPQPTASSQQPSHVRVNSSQQQGTAGSTSSQAQLSYQPEMWPTPNPSEWANIEVVAERAGAALSWVLSPTVKLHAPAANVKLVAGQLSELLQLILIGHLPDWNLNISTLFQATLKPVLAALLAGYQQYTELAVAMLSEMAKDSDLIPDNMKEANR